VISRIRILRSVFGNQFQGKKHHASNFVPTSLVLSVSAHPARHRCTRLGGGLYLAGRDRATAVFRPPPESRDYQRWEPPENPNSDLQLPEPRAHSPVVSGNDDEDERSSNARSEKLRQDKQCREYEAELERINNQLRAGYREPKGNRLRAKRRRLRSREFNECM